MRVRTIDIDTAHMERFKDYLNEEVKNKDITDFTVADIINKVLDIRIDAVISSTGEILFQE
jgi:hypothetical protein